MSNPTRTFSHSLPAVSETSHDLCAGLRVTATTLRLWELSGRIPTPVRVGKRKLWPAGTVAKLLAGAEAAA